MPTPPERALPATIGRFVVEAEIGRGMMGIVYKAHDPVMDRPVAVKVVHLAFAVSDAQSDEFEQRFLAEARIVARLSHPNIVVAYDVGLAGEHGPPYIALEYLTGRTLAQVLAEGRPPWRDSLHLVARLARALHYAHEQGVVHRDIKPANVMLLSSGEPKLMDFGLAKLDTGLERGVTGPFVGTPLYMSPEQALGESVDARSDLFSLGALAYTLLTGRRAFEAEGVPRILQRVIHADPPPPTRVDRTLPAAVDYLIARALSKPRTSRYPDGLTLAEDFEDVLAQHPPRHRAGWVPPVPPGEETLDSPPAPAAEPAEPAPHARAPAARNGAPRELGTRPPAPPRAPPAHAAGTPLTSAAEAPARRALERAPGAARRAHLSLTLLVVSMLAFGATLVLSPFWRQQLAEALGVGTAISPLLEPGAAAPALASVAPPAAPSSEPSARASVEPDAALEPASPSPSTPVAVETPPGDPAPPTPAPDGDAPVPATPEPPATPTPPDTPAGVAPTPAPAEATPGPRPTAATIDGGGDTGAHRPARPAPRRATTPPATARLSIALTHDLPRGRLKVLIDGRPVIDEALQARRKRYLLVFNRREGTLERELAVVPGRRRITVQVRSGSRLHAEERRELFAAGVTRQLELRVSGADGLSFDWR